MYEEGWNNFEDKDWKKKPTHCRVAPMNSGCWH